jgi:hypothetical protein
MPTYYSEEIINTTHLVPFSKYYKLDQFDCGIPEYNQFLIDSADVFQNSGITNTQLLLDNFTGNIIGYISLCMSSVKLTDNEKCSCHLESVPYKSVPALLLGKLAVDKNYRSKRKGYGSYLVAITRGFAAEINNNGIACRFVVVDADIQYNPNTPQFYRKNLFVPNESCGKQSHKTTFSMRLDIYNDGEERKDQAQAS